MKKDYTSILFCLLALCFFGDAFGQKPNLIIPTGHANGLISFDFSSDGEYLLTGGQDGIVKLWKVQTGQELQSYCGPKGYGVTDALFTPDDRKIIIGADDGVVFIFETFTGKILTTFSQPDLGAVKAVAVSPDGQKVWSAHEYMLAYWDINSTEILFKSGAHTQHVNDIAISPTGQYGISTGNDQTTILWDLNNFQPLKNLIGHTAPVIWCDFVLNGRYAVSADMNKNLFYWDPATGISAGGTTIAHSGSLTKVAISEGNQYLVTQTYASVEPRGNEAKLWRISDQGLTLMNSLDGGSTDKAIAISPDNQFVVTGSRNTGVGQLWDLQSGQARQSYKSYAQGIATSYMTDKQLVTISSDFWGTIKIFDLEQNKDVKVLMEDNESAITSSAISKDGQLLVANQVGASKAYLFDLETLSPLPPFVSPVGQIVSLDLSPDQQYLATSTETAAYLWNLQTGAQVRSFKGHDSNVFQVSISPDQRFLFMTTSFAGYLWDLNNGQIILSDLMKSEAGETEIKYAFSNNGKYLAVGDWQKGIQLWDLETREEKFLFKSFSVGGFSSFSFSQDNKFLIAGEWNGDIQVYDIATQKPAEAFDGYGNQVRNLGASDKNGFILSSSEDQTTKILKMDGNNALREKAQLISLGKRDWAIVTPAGLFDASPGAMELMYFVVSNQNDYEVMELE